MGITQPLAKALETRVGVTQSLGTHPNGAAKVQSSEGESTRATSAVATVAKTCALRCPSDQVLQPIAREAWNTMVLQYHAQKEQDRNSGCARSLAQKQWRQERGHSVQEAMITRDAYDTQPAVQGEEVPEGILSMSNMQGWKKQRLDPASAPVASATSSQEGVVAVKGSRVLLAWAGSAPLEGHSNSC